MFASARLAGAPGVEMSAPRRFATCWRERELWLLAVLVLGIYFTRLTDLTIRGEESRWARVAQEMIDTGDWIVPRQQYEPFPDRPPLNSWAMILASKFTGGLNLAAVRLPAVIAILLTTVLIYLYSRNFLSPFGALAAGACYPTMGQVLQLGRVGESDALLTLCVTGALFCWHWAYARRRDPLLAWTAGYALAAVAGLCKGPQGPVYFVGITGLYLACQRDWRFLFAPAHLAGLAVFAAVLGAWQLPFWWELDATSAQAIWSEGGELSERFDYSNFPRVLRHWLSYPCEVLVCMLPWSIMLIVLPSRWLRARMDDARPMVMFLLTALALAFVTCWIPAQSRARYFMSLYPCVAPLVGLIIQRCWEARENSWWQRSWDRYLLGGAVLIGLSGAGVFLVRAWGGVGISSAGPAISRPFAAIYALGAALAVAIVLWARKSHDPLHGRWGVLTLAGFIGFTYTGIVLSVQVAISNNPAETVAAIRDVIPKGERLVSFGKVHHLFAYYYGRPIELQKLGEAEPAVRMPGEYFCFAVDPKYKPPTIPFAWEAVAEVSCERGVSPRPLTKVIVGRCKPSTFHLAGDQSDAMDDDDRASDSSADPSIARGVWDLQR